MVTVLTSSQNQNALQPQSFYNLGASTAQNQNIQMIRFHFNISGFCNKSGSTSYRDVHQSVAYKLMEISH